MCGLFADPKEVGLEVDNTRVNVRRVMCVLC